VKLTVQNAEIKTATVEIRTLTISGKQVTLAVYRQLHHVDWFGSGNTPLGVAWGTVNYCAERNCGAFFDGWSRKPEPRPHTHVVWQQGSDLRRFTFVNPLRTSGGTLGRLRAWEAVQQLPQLFIAV
jgi:hypothetical protein